MMEVMAKIRSSVKKKYYLNCLIVEGDKAKSNSIKDMAEELGLRVLAIAKSFQEVDQALTKYSLDIILSDSVLNNYDTLQTYFSLKEGLPPLILFTDFQENRNKNNNSIVFLERPFDTAGLKTAMDGAFRSLSEAMQRDGDIQKNEYNLYVKSSGKLISLDANQISHIKAEGNYCIFYLEGKKILIRSSISNALNIIDEPNFIQIHRGYIANVHNATELIIRENKLLAGNEKLPVGRKYKKELVDFFKKN